MNGVLHKVIIPPTLSPFKEFEYVWNEGYWFLFCFVFSYTEYYYDYFMIEDNLWISPFIIF